VLKKTPHLSLDLMLHLAGNFHVQKEIWLDSRWSIPLKQEWQDVPTLPVKSSKPLHSSTCLQITRCSHRRFPTKYLFLTLIWK